MLRTLRFAVAGAVVAALAHSGLVSIVSTGAPVFAQVPAVSGDAAAMSNRCAAKPFDGASGPMWNGWGRDLNNSRYQPDPGFTADQISRMKLTWAFGFPNAVSAWGQPTVVGGRVFLGVDTGHVYAVDAVSGCVYWSHKAQAGVRSAVSIGRITAAGATRYAAYFGDLAANVYAVDAETGALLWTKRADTHVRARITGAPTFYEGRVYVPVSSLEEGRARVPSTNAARSAAAWSCTTPPTASRSGRVKRLPRRWRRRKELRLARRCGDLQARRSGRRRRSIRAAVCSMSPRAMRIRRPPPTNRTPWWRWI